MTRTQAWLRYIILCALLYLFARSTILNAATLSQDVTHGPDNEMAATSGMPMHWSGKIRVYAVAGEHDITDKIKSGIWSWRERSGADIVYEGKTPSENYGASYAVKISVVSALKVFQVSGSLDAEATTLRTYYLETGEIIGAVIYIGEQWLSRGDDYVQYIINHEIGHAIGITTHSSVDHDIMYAAHVHSRYAPTAADGIAAGYNPRPCFAEIMDNGGVYIAGAGAYLRSVGGNVWRLEQYSPVSVSCANLERDGMDFMVRDLRGRSASYSWARMEWIGGDDWLLVGGE